MKKHGAARLPFRNRAAFSMKFTQASFAIMLLLLAACGVDKLNAQPSGPSDAEVFPSLGLRQNINFNRDWKFQLGDNTNAAAPRV